MCLIPCELPFLASLSLLSLYLLATTHRDAENASEARPPLPARVHLGRGGSKLRTLLRARREGRALFVQFSRRSGGCPPHSTYGTHRPGLALLPLRHLAGPAVR